MAEGLKSAEYYKSLQPGQLIAERGSELVVINPGSKNLRIGQASWQAPAVLPHCIAWHAPGKTSENPSKKGVGEQLTRQAAKRSDREQTFMEVESLLGARPVSEPETAFKDEPMRGGFQKQNADNNRLDVQWTRVTRDSFDSANDVLHSTYRPFICGEEALRIPAAQPYVLRRPMCRGRLNISGNYSMQQVCDDICVIWDWVLSSKLSIDKNARKQLSAVLVVPDTFDNREVKEMLNILLRDLEFYSVVVHQECIAASFGNGVSSACVVELGAQVTCITCVEDGVPISTTHRVLPYGGEDISRCLLWVQQQHENWPPLRTDPLADPLDMIMLDRLKESHCSLSVVGEQVATAEVYSESEFYRVNLVALNVPAAGLFYPSILAPEERRLSVRRWHYDHEDMLVDPAEPASGNDSSLNARNSTLSSSDNPLVGLHESIISSILSTGTLVNSSTVSLMRLTGRSDLKNKFFSSILLAGGVASTRGIAECLEDKVIRSIPRQESIDRVEVLPGRKDPSFLCWRGGLILGLLDSSREGWVQRADWIDGGLRVGSSRKYKDAFSVHAQAFWYNAALE